MKINVLIVDDNTSITGSLTKLLKYKKIDCIAVNDGKTGLSLMEQKQFDVVLLDISMPEFSGYDVMNELIQSGKIKEQKIIILTATMLDGQKIDELQEMGVHSILQKPTTIKSLIEVMS